MARCGPRRVGRSVDHPAPHPTSQHGTLGDFWSVATMATMATLVADLLTKIFTSEFSWVFITPASQPSLKKIQFQFRGGHGGHGRRLSTRRACKAVVALAVAAACPDAHHSTHGEASGRVPGARHAMACSPLGAGASIVAKFVGGEKAAREISRQERAGASRGGWGRARCMPRGCGRCPATRSRRRVHEDRTRTPRWPATAESPLSRRSRPVR